MVNRCRVFRFVQADTIVPQPGDVPGWDRYAYVENNPLRYADPSGHWMCGDEYDPGCAETPFEMADYLKATFQLRIPKVVKRWEEIKDDPADLLARAMLAEEGEKIYKDTWQDLLGVGWVIRNRHDFWYDNIKQDPRYRHYQRVQNEDKWLRAATSGIYGMAFDKKVGFSSDIQANWWRYGKSLEEAVWAYNVAYEMALKVLGADRSNDPVREAVYYADADAEQKPYKRTHFWDENGYSHFWCMPDTDVCQ